MPGSAVGEQRAGMANPFLDVTRLEQEGGGRYRGVITEDWVLRPLPQGGVVTAMALRGMQAELDHPEQRLRTLHTSFVGQVAAGPVEVEVEVLRRGRSMSHARAEVRNPGADRGHLTTAIFGAERRGFHFTDLEAPADRPPPADCRSFREPPPPGVEPFPPMAFWDELVEGRAIIGPRATPRPTWRSGTAATRARTSRASSPTAPRSSCSASRPPDRSGAGGPAGYPTEGRVARPAAPLRDLAQRRVTGSSP